MENSQINKRLENNNNNLNNNRNKSIAIQLNYTDVTNLNLHHNNNFLSIKSGDFKLRNSEEINNKENNGKNTYINNSKEKNNENEIKENNNENFRNDNTTQNKITKKNLQEKFSFKQIDFMKIKRELLMRAKNETLSNIKSIETDITIRSDSSDAYIREKVRYFPIAGRKYSKIVKKFSNLGSSEKLQNFKLSSG